MLRDTAIAFPRVYVAGLSPQEIESHDYYTKTEVDELIDSATSGAVDKEYVDEHDTLLQEQITTLDENKQDEITEDAKLDYSLLSGTPSIPTKTSDLENDSGFATSSYVQQETSGKADKTELENYQKLITNDAKLGYDLLSGTPSIPTKTSDLQNDSDFATSSYVQQETSGKADKTELEDYQLKITDTAKLDYELLSGTPTIPTKTSDLENDSGFATSGYVQQETSGKADKSDLDDYQKLITNESKLDYALLSGTPTIPLSTSQLTNDSGYATSGYVQQETSGKMDTPSGGTAGQVLTKTTNGEKWDDIEIPEETNPAFIQLEGKSSAAGVFVVDFAGKQIQKYGLNSTADGAITFSVENSGAGVSGCAPTIEVQIPISGDTTVAFPDSVQVIDFPDSLTGAYSKDRIAKSITYHDIVFRNEQNFNGKWQTYANYAYKFDESDEYDYFWIEAAEDDSTLSFDNWNASYNLSTSFDKVTWTALTSNVIATGANTGTKVYIIGNTTTLGSTGSNAGCRPTSDKKYKIGGSVFSLYSDWLEPKTLTNSNDLRRWQNPGKPLVECNLDLKHISNAAYMFAGSQLSSIQLINCDTLNNCTYMFASCGNLSGLPAISFSNAQNTSYMFSSLSWNKIPDGLNIPNITDAQFMFYGNSYLKSIGDNVKIANGQSATSNDNTYLTKSFITAIGDNFEWFTNATFGGTWDPALGIKNVFPNCTSVGSGWKVYNHYDGE